MSSVPAPTQATLRTLEWVHRRENLVVCGPSGTGKTFLLEALGQHAVETGLHVAWFTLESLGVLVRRHRADDTSPRRSPAFCAPTSWPSTTSGCCRSVPTPPKASTASPTPPTKNARSQSVPTCTRRGGTSPRVL
jgi:hypothetical protein